MSWLRQQFTRLRLFAENDGQHKVDLYRLVHVAIAEVFNGSALSKHVNTPCFCMVLRHHREEKIAFCSI